MIKANYRKKILEFRYPAETSRGVLLRKPSWYVFLFDEEAPEIRGIGECSIIPGLSRETEQNVDDMLDTYCRGINSGEADLQSEESAFPSVRFGIETALRDLKSGGKRVLFPSSFTSGNSSVSFNGLIWMGPNAYIQQQIEEKLDQGFHCLKLKIGALKIEDELQILKSIRQRFSSKELELRVDANGAFEPGFAREVINRLAELEIHSIEQPVRAGQREEMAGLCLNSPVAVALDEELLGDYTSEEKRIMIRTIRPQYLVVKPGLLGGFQKANEYISIANEEKIGWWITSALESNIGLNAIAQWTFILGNPRYQGLGTGKLYRHNIQCPLKTEGEKLFYDPHKKWNLSFIESA